jgi:hypothetical protein
MEQQRRKADAEQYDGCRLIVVDNQIFEHSGSPFLK